MSLRALIGTIGLAVAIVTAVAVPAGFWLVGHTNLAHELDLKARITAGRLARYIYQQDAMWRYQRVRLIELIELSEADGDPFRQRVYDGDGRLAADTPAAPDAPTLTRSEPIVVAGAVVGRVDVDASLRPLIGKTAVVALFSFALGFGAFWALRIFPLRVLDRTIGELETANRATREANKRLQVQNEELIRKRTELQTQNERFDAALSNMSQGLCMLDAQQRMVVANPRLSQILELPPSVLRPGLMLEQLVEGAVAHGYSLIDASDVLTELQSIWREGKATSAIRRVAGRTLSAQYQPLPDGGWLATYEDITERRLAEARISHMARHDALTDLPNRLQFREEMDQALRSIPRGKALAVMCLDLDQFKSVNDALGHPVGDLLLQSVADRIRNCLREHDMVSRLGGDEFAVLQREAKQPEGSTALAQRILDAVGAPYELDGHHLVIGTSIGISIAPIDGCNADILMKNADLALYRAKADGRGTYRYFEPGMDARMQARRALELDLRGALANRQFELVYQPLVDVATETITGFEALLRWNHPARGAVPPVEFIPIAEETGLILQIGEWVIRQACADAAKWPDQLRVAVNLSPTQFRNRSLINVVLRALATSQLAPNRLELEITESVLLKENEASIDTLNQLRRLGIRISMDDFGTGYSSLSYLRSFPFDKVKIDRLFIRELSTKQDTIAIIRAVAGLAHSLGMTTTAEGVETREQFERLKLEGCTEVQGYLFGRPRPVTELGGLVDERAAATQAVA